MSNLLDRSRVQAEDRVPDRRSRADAPQGRQAPSRPAPTPHTPAPVRNRWTALTNPARVSTAVAVMVGVTLSVFPSYLPHDPVTQGVLTTGFVAIVLAVVRRLRAPDPTLVGPIRRIMLVPCGAATGVAAVSSHLSQDRMRAGIGMAPRGVTYYALLAGTVALLLLLGHIIRMAWRHRARLRRPGLVLALIAVVISPVSPVQAAPHLSVPTASSDHPLAQPSPVGAVRAWAAQRPGEGMRERATRAVDRLVAEGGLTRSRIVVAMPTGSGWVDPDFVTGLERRFGRDVATVGMPYDDLPSWMSYLVHQDDATAAARALFGAVAARVGALPPAQRPDLDVYGESLGATAGQAIFTGPGGTVARRQVCAVLWVGSPGGSSAGLPRESLVSNADDPVVHTHPSDLWSPPSGGGAWLPGVSFVQRGADLVDALLVPEGSGHHYGPGQADALQTCRSDRKMPLAGWQREVSRRGR